MANNGVLKFQEVQNAEYSGSHVLKFQGVREIKSNNTERIFPWRSTTHWKLVPNGSNRYDLSLCKVHRVTRVQYDHDDRGLRNLVPAMPLNRIVTRYPEVTAVSDVIEYRDNVPTPIAFLFTSIFWSSWIFYRDFLIACYTAVNCKFLYVLCILNYKRIIFIDCHLVYRVIKTMRIIYLIKKLLLGEFLSFGSRKISVNDLLL